MKKLLELIYQKNEELGYAQRIENESSTSKILMIDGKTSREASSLMLELFTFATSWAEGLSGMSMLNPNTLESAYQNEAIKTKLDLTSENYKPLPPSDPSDWNRTAVLASEEFGLGLVLLWWRAPSVEEPSVVVISGGDVKVFFDLMEYLEYLAHGVFPEKGDEIYTNLEQNRGRLGGS